MLQISRHTLGRFSLVIAVAALCANLVACGSMDRQASPDNQNQFTPDWSANARPLFYHGMGRDPGYNIWQVPNNLPNGTYRVIVRKKGPAGDKAELVDGQRFEIDATRKDVYLNIPTNYVDPEALGEKYIVGLDGAATK